MTLFPDTQTQVSSDATRRGRGPSRLELSGVGIALAAGIGVVSPSSAGQSDYALTRPRPLLGWRSRRRRTSRPTQALDGQTLAGYLADHYSDRVARTLSSRTRTVRSRPVLSPACR